MKASMPTTAEAVTIPNKVNDSSLPLTLHPNFERHDEA